MKTYSELISELEEKIVLSKQKSQADFMKQKRDRMRKDQGGQKKKIQNKKYAMSAKGKLNKMKAKKAALKGKTATGRDMTTRNVSGMGGRERLQQKKKDFSQK